jgi:3-oxoadipate enol-lactonase/4-carboxymuconolactone decarboxylase
MERRTGGAVIPHYRIDGADDAPTLVLAHSLGADSDMWAPQVPELSHHFRVVRYDQRGHGVTPCGPTPFSIDDLAGDVVSLLDDLGVGRVSFCGLSLGGMVGMAFAAAQPTRVDRLVLCSTSARLGPPEQWQERAALVRRGGVGAVSDAVLGRWFTAPFAAARPDVVASTRASLERTDPAGYAACCDAIGAMDLLARLPAIAAPTLVVAAALDPATPPEHGERIASLVPGARLVVVPDAAHLVNVEAADRVTVEILSHLLPDGLRVRREVLGDAYVDAALAGASPFTADFQRFITEYAWGGVWSRPGLDRRTRSCITVAMLVALGQPEELALHLRAARTNGVTRDELREILLQSAVYCGVPAANRAFAVAVQTFGDDG